MNTKEIYQRIGSLINERTFIEDAIEKHGPREDLLESWKEINEAIEILKKESGEACYER